MLKEGRISEVGTYRDLMNQDGDFAEFISTFMEDPDSDMASCDEMVDVMEG